MAASGASVQSTGGTSAVELNDSPVVDAAGSAHKRTYQACIPCRKRKVRCDLGPVDDPHEPPCVRCRRESKECFFSATRRKRRADSGEDEARDANDINDDFVAHDVRKKSARTSSFLDEEPSASHHARRSIASASASATSPGGGYGLTQEALFQQRSPFSSKRAQRQAEDVQDQEVTNETAAALFQSPINTPGDALHLLLKASGESEDIQRRDTSSQKRPGTREREETLPRGGGSHRSRKTGSRQQSGYTGYSSNIDPAITEDGLGPDRASPSKETLNTWSRLRFVRAGWFTAREAISYIDYYYQYLAPMTPVNIPDFRNLEATPDLLSDEPMLTVTLLTIASRYKKLSGPGGQTRSYMIHEKLWTFLQNMITRMFWGQEQYGGGFSGAGPRKKWPKPTEKGGLRTLGTIESLLLLSDFHPRSMHFPPGDDNDDILAPAEESIRNMYSNGHETQDTQSGGESTFAGWTEPALRSDRMSWSLIGLSHALAYELGIFGSFSEGSRSPDGRFKRQGGSPAYYKRADRIERLLYIYITQACGRFGFPSMYPDRMNKFNLSSINEGHRSVDSTTHEAQCPEDEIQQFWVGVAYINKTCDETLFPSKDQTARFIQSGEYLGRIQQMQPLLLAWQKRFEQSNVDKYPRLALLIDFHYFRLYINALALQAVLEQWTTKLGAGRQDSIPQSPESTVSSSFATLYGRNEFYIKEVIDAARTLLQYVVDGLLPGDYLKHAPVRIYFRIVSAAMFLLKTFALGAKKEEVDISLHLLDQTIDALRTSVVDDVHLCLRIADLLECLTSSIRHKFVRFAPRSTEEHQQSAKDPSDQHLPPNTSAHSQERTGRQAYNVRYVRQPYAEDGSGQDMSAGTHLGAYDNNITVMPPPRSVYDNSNFDFPGSMNPQPYTMQQQQQHPHQQQQQNIYPTDNHNSLPFPSEEDWLTLDLNPLLESNNLDGGENQWFGAFGPETHNNLEVLGKLVNEQWQPGDLGF